MGLHASLSQNCGQSFGDKVKIVERGATLGDLRRYGTSEPLINGKVKLPGPASEEDVRKAIQEGFDAFGS
jgi:hypothetical protein